MLVSLSLDERSPKGLTSEGGTLLPEAGDYKDGTMGLIPQMLKKLQTETVAAGVKEHYQGEARRNWKQAGRQHGVNRKGKAPFFSSSLTISLVCPLLVQWDRESAGKADRGLQTPSFRLTRTLQKAALGPRDNCLVTGTTIHQKFEILKTDT